MRLEPTRPRLLVALAAPAAAFGWGFARVFETTSGRMLPVPWTAAAALGVLAVGLVAWALGVRRRLAAAREPVRTAVPRGREVRPLDPIVAARTAALAMAASRTGALVGGFYLGVGLSFVDAWASDASRSRALSAGAAALAAVLVVAAALWLERICRLPDPPDSADPGPSGDDSSATAWGHPRVADPGPTAVAWPKPRGWRSRPPTRRVVRGVGRHAVTAGWTSVRNATAVSGRRGAVQSPWRER